MRRKAYSEDTPVTIRFAFLWAIVGAAALAGAAWGVSQYQISHLKESVRKTEEAQSFDHDLLVRIDERTAKMEQEQRRIFDRLFPPPHVAGTTK